MLTFYPEFEVDNITDNEIIVLLDLSNSMKVCAQFCIRIFSHEKYCQSCSSMYNA